MQTITATLLIQVGADQPKPIGTIEIPLHIEVGGNAGQEHLAMRQVRSPGQGFRSYCSCGWDPFRVPGMAYYPENDDEASRWVNLHISEAGKK